MTHQRFKASPTECRPVFQATDIEWDEQDTFYQHIEIAVDRLEREIDLESIALFRSYNIPPPIRLQEIADADYKYGF